MARRYARGIYLTALVLSACAGGRPHDDMSESVYAGPAGGQASGTEPVTPHDSQPAPSPTPTPTVASVDANTVPSIAVTGRAPRVSGYGNVSFVTDANVGLVGLTTTMVVPPPPDNNNGTLFLWPGIQPNGSNFEPIDNGVLQPVLTWGGSCAPGQQPANYSTWWISSQYVNTFGHAPGYAGCYGGNMMSVAVGDKLAIHMYLRGTGTTWTQDVTDLNTGASVTFSMDMLGQMQNIGEFIIESYGPQPVTDVIFTDTTLTLATSSPRACWPKQRGTDDYVSPPRASPDGMHCAIDEIILRAQNVPATDPHPPGP